MITPNFIIVVGLSGVGKTTFCNYLSEVSGLKTINSGNAIREFLSSQNIEVKNRTETGDIFLKKFSEEKLYQIVRECAIKKKANILDGIRLKSTLNYFLSEDAKQVVIYIEADEALRHNRFLSRLTEDKTTKDQAEQIIFKKNSYFDEIISLKKKADYIVDNNSNDLKHQAEIIWEMINFKFLAIHH